MDALSRRHFLRTSGAVIGAVVAPTIVMPDTARAAEHESIPRIWHSAEVLIGNSLADQTPGLVITCPFFFPNGKFANASHTLDLSMVASGGPAQGNITWDGDSISPDFSRSIAATTVKGSDGITYLLVAGEAQVEGGEGRFKDVNYAVIRCKYKVVIDTQGQPLLEACSNCVAILVRD
jgi:hypothetical protein